MTEIQPRRKSKGLESQKEKSTENSLQTYKSIEGIGECFYQNKQMKEAIGVTEEDRELGLSEVDCVHLEILSHSVSLHKHSAFQKC